MAHIDANRHSGRRPTHPGELLREDIIPATGRSKTEIAEMLGISRQQLYDMMDETDPKPVTPAMAVRLGKLFGNGPDVWIGMQRAYDTWKAIRDTDVSDIRTIEFA